MPSFLAPHASTDTREQEDLALLELLDEESQLLIYNDDHNTFDWVIQCLVEVLGHSSEQSEQLAMIIHYKGKATVKSGSHDELQPLKDALCDRGLSAVIEGMYA